MKVKNVSNKPIIIKGVRIEPGEIKEVKAKKKDLIGLKVEVMKTKRKGRTREMKREIKKEESEE